MKKYFLRLFQYNSWANRRVLGVLEHSGSDDDRPLRLFAHVLAAEKIWMNRLRRQDSGTLAVFPDLPVEGCLPLLADNARAWIEYVESVPEDEFFKLLTYKNLKGEIYTIPVAEILAHVVNHGTYHRGQIAARLRELGTEPPRTDFIVFARPA